MKKKIKVGIVGMGYVGSALFNSILSKKIDVVGYDISDQRINFLKKRYLKKIVLSTNSNVLKDRNFFIICVPTPVKSNKSPDLNSLKNSCKLVSKYLKKNDIVIFESTVYPGITRNFCLPLLMQKKNLKDFFIGYSPERYSPGDKNKLENITKLVSGENFKITKKINEFYSLFIKKTYMTKSIEIAEMAKNFENCQRDHNIALLNELKMLCDKSKLNVYDVMDACKTKWNYNNYFPGLVGGHCISVDPYYLIDYSKLNKFSFTSIINSRKINENFLSYIYKKISLFLKFKKIGNNSKILLIGATYKSNIDDTRNSGPMKIYKRLKKNYSNLEILDPYLNLKNKFKIKDYKAIIILTLHNKIKKSVNIMKYIKKNKEICLDPFNQI